MTTTSIREPNDDDPVIAAVDAAKQEILDVLSRLQRQLDVTDQDLHDVIEHLQRQIELLIHEAKAYEKVGLRLDDLFEVVIRLTGQAQEIDAVDLEPNRWELDARAQRYFTESLAALHRGARIRRIYVISPHVDQAGMESIENAIKHHLASNDDDEVKTAGGRLEIGALRHSQIPAGEGPRDFAMFDGDKVLVEDFDEWRSTYRGRLTKKPVEVNEHRFYFRNLWKDAEKLRSTTDVTQWAEQTRAAITRQDFDYDVFLGYCSEAKGTALEIKNFMTATCGRTVYDWREMPSGPALLGEIDKASRTSRLGLFLFTADDLLEDGGAAPRDNVVFELGYFMSRKGPEKVLAVFEEGAKQPTDIAGNIFVPLADRSNTSTIETRLRAWLDQQLGAG